MRNRLLKFNTLLVAIVMLLLLTNTASASGFAKVGIFFGTWEGLTTSAKLSALGGADLADDGPSTLLVNPAPLGSVSSAEFSYNHTDYFGSIELHTYAASVEISGFRLNLAQLDFVSDDLLVRTAFNPEGTGETFKFRERMRLLGLSYNLSRILGEDSRFSWSIGLAWREYTGFFDDTKGEGTTLDLGTTLRWTAYYDEGWTSLTGVAMRQNTSNAKYSIDERDSFLPSSHRLGLTFETALRKAGQTTDQFKLLVAHAHNAPIQSSFRRATDHFGVELLFFEILAARYGYNTFIADGVSSWGLGAILDRQWMGPWTIELDWGQMNFNHEALIGDKTLWGFRVRHNF